jgi:hypothetical protein
MQQRTAGNGVFYAISAEAIQLGHSELGDRPTEINIRSEAQMGLETRTY